MRIEHLQSFSPPDLCSNAGTAQVDATRSVCYAGFCALVLLFLQLADIFRMADCQRGSYSVVNGTNIQMFLACDPNSPNSTLSFDGVTPCGHIDQQIELPGSGIKLLHTGEWCAKSFELDPCLTN